MKIRINPMAIADVREMNGIIHVKYDNSIKEAYIEIRNELESRMQFIKKYK